MIHAKLFEEFENKFSKIIIRTNNGDKSLKGVVSIIDKYIRIRGDFQTTYVLLRDIIRICKMNSHAWILIESGKWIWNIARLTGIKLLSLMISSGRSSGILSEKFTSNGLMIYLSHLDDRPIVSGYIGTRRPVCVRFPLIFS